MMKMRRLRILTERMGHRPTVVRAVAEIVRVQIALIAAVALTGIVYLVEPDTDKDLIIQTCMLVLMILFLMGGGISLMGIHLWIRRPRYDVHEPLSASFARNVAVATTIIGMNMIAMFGMALVAGAVTLIA